MKILYISYDGITDPIGQSQIVPYIRGLSRKNACFTVLTFEKKIDHDAATETLGNEIRWRKLRYHKNPPIISTLYDTINGTIKGISILAKEKIRIIHARGYVSAGIALILKQIFGAKFIFDMRGMWAEEKVDAGIWKKDGLWYKITKYFEKMFFLNAEEIIVLTHNFKKTVSKPPYVKHTNVDVIPTCTDTNQFLPNVPISTNRGLGLNAKFTLIYLGSLGTFYGLEEMIGFFSVISKHYTDNPLFLILTNNPSSSIHELMRLKKIPKENYMIKHMPYRELKEILPTANVSLMFYKRILSGAGCCPTKFGESLACGLPVIINSGIGDTEEIIRKEKVGVVVNEFSDTAYNKAAVHMSELLSEGDALRQRCRAAADKYFSLADGTEKYWQVYQKLLRT